MIMSRQLIVLRRTVMLLAITTGSMQTVSAQLGEQKIFAALAPHTRFYVIQLDGLKKTTQMNGHRLEQ